MKHYLVEGNTLPEAYHAALKVLHEKGKMYPCPDYDTTMKEVSLTFCIENVMQEPMISKLFPGGHHELQQYVMEIVDGILDFMIGKGEHVWEYTYHERFAHQLPWIYSEIKKNPFTRRATMNIRDFEVDTSNDHPACLQSIGFYVRDGKLDMKVTMRSNDAVQATFMNAIGFIGLQQKVAGDLGYEVGSYTHTAYSFHAYERNLPLLKKYIKDISYKSLEELTYNFTEFYGDLMREEVPSIMAMVKEQKEKYGVTE